MRALVAICVVLPACLFFDSVGPPKDTCADGLQSGDELGVDCGGPCAAACPTTGCTTNADCTNATCESGVCVPITLTQGNITFTPTLPTHKGRYFGSHDVAKRTLTFTHDGDNAECSHDGGTTYAPCDMAGVLVFTLQDYDDGRELRVRVKKAGSQDLVYAYTPKTVHPGLSFYACDEIVTANEGFSAFFARMTTGRTICLGSGVRITSDARAQLDPNAAGLYILGLEAAPAVFVNASSYIFNFNVGATARTPNHILAHAELQVNDSVGWNGTYAGQVVLSDVHLTIDGWNYGVWSDGDDNDLLIEDSLLEGLGGPPCNGTWNPVRFTAQSALATPNLVIRRSTIRSRYSVPVIITNGTALIEDSTVERTTTTSCTNDPLAAVDVHGGDVTIRRSTLQSEQRALVVDWHDTECGGGGGAICSSVSQTVTLDGATLRAKETLIGIGAPAAAPALRVTLQNGTVLRRTSPGTAGSAIAINPGFTHLNCAGAACTGQPIIDEPTPNTVFCYEAASPSFQIQSGVASASGSFAAGSHTVVPCP